MICPACKYEYQWKWNQTKEERDALPSEGDFFYMDKKRMRRDQTDSPFQLHEKADLYACPKCGVAFIAVKENEATK